MIANVIHLGLILKLVVSEEDELGNAGAFVFRAEVEYPKTMPLIDIPNAKQFAEQFGFEVGMEVRPPERYMQDGSSHAFRVTKIREW